MSKLTASRDLRTGKLFWPAFDRPVVPTVPLDRDKRVEVAILGGEDEPFVDEDRRDALIASKVETLVRKMHELKPTIEFEPEFQWAGTFAETEDAMPYIGPHPEHPNMLLALGYGGNGVTFSSIAGRCLTGIVTGDETLARPAELFTIRR
jgi:glycine/D-amino acid oxidase-like deaminating enzyme